MSGRQKSSGEEPPSSRTSKTATSKRRSIRQSFADMGASAYMVNGEDAHARSKLIGSTSTPKVKSSSPRASSSRTVKGRPSQLGSPGSSNSPGPDSVERNRKEAHLDEQPDARLVRGTRSGRNSIGSSTGTPEKATTSITALRVQGKAVLGGKLTVIGNLPPGSQRARFTWYRLWGTLSGRVMGEKIACSGPSYCPDVCDVGCRLHVMVAPKLNTGEYGPVCSAVTKKCVQECMEENSSQHSASIQNFARDSAESALEEQSHAALESYVRAYAPGSESGTGVSLPNKSPVQSTRDFHVPQARKDSLTGCVSCGGLRFVPCQNCGRSGMVTEIDKVTGKQTMYPCGKCQENGLAPCMECIMLDDDRKKGSENGSMAGAGREYEMSFHDLESIQDGTMADGYDDVDRCRARSEQGFMADESSSRMRMARFYQFSGTEELEAELDHRRKLKAEMKQRKSKSANPASDEYHSNRWQARDGKYVPGEHQAMTQIDEDTHSLGQEFEDDGHLSPDPRASRHDSRSRPAASRRAPQGESRHGRPAAVHAEIFTEDQYEDQYEDDEPPYGSRDAERYYDDSEEEDYYASPRPKEQQLYKQNSDAFSLTSMMSYLFTPSPAKPTLRGPPAPKHESANGLDPMDEWLDDLPDYEDDYYGDEDSSSIFRISKTKTWRWCAGAFT
ncbi:hypothetical protein CYMTET_56441 [Cymbomonas tetramitiformis]|uniref:Uncharacterized protein n=1 Tax=Cymbomonas tetramitiformis TaxID=36881 RepID=A0AAE0BC34_9CHLO|nr:hypothetical protein CYMTET_56441 [Cymbomonas tetramitiformis]